MPHGYQGLRLFDVPCPCLFPAHIYSDHQEYVLGKESTVVFDHQKAEYTPGCFSSKTSDAEKNLTVAYAPAHSSSRKNDRATSLGAGCAPAYFFSTKRMGKLQQMMSSMILVSSVMVSFVVAGYLGGVVDLTHG